MTEPMNPHSCEELPCFPGEKEQPGQGVFYKIRMPLSAIVGTTEPTTIYRLLHAQAFHMGRSPGQRLLSSDMVEVSQCPSFLEVSLS